ncbi:MAG: hypothetical protein MPN21_18580 [Thermoanaerobaculia bacterium]|nr:hypothetical protein [Thermoanaerobaculia bacterium]
MPSRRQIVSGLVLCYLAVSLSVLISQQAKRIATSHSHNPYLFTAHFSAENYQDIEDPFKPRLFSYLLVAPFVTLDLPPSKLGSAGRISGEAFERLVTGWTFAWMLAVLLLCASMPRPLLGLFGITAGVSFAYGLQGMVYPYDLPALFFATLVVVLVRHRRARWLPLVLALGTGFKETLAVFSVLPFFLDGSRKERLRAVGYCLLACFWVFLAIDFYSGRSFWGFEAVTAADDAQDAGRWKLALNLPLAMDPSSLVLFVNAGLALPLFFLPVGGDRLARGFRWVGALFVAGLFLLAQAREFRIFFELIPLCLYSVSLATSSRLRSVGSEPTGLPSRSGPESAATT